MAELTGLRKQPAKKTIKLKRSVGTRQQTPVRDTPVHRFVAKISASEGVPYKTTREVAEELGVSTGWIRKVQRNNLLGVPSKAAQFGRMQIYLYSPKDIERIRAYLSDRQKTFANPGRLTGPVESWEEVIRRRERASKDADSA